MSVVTIEDFKQIYAEFTKKPAPAVSDSDKLETLNLDSLAMLEIVGSLEERAGTEVNEDDLVDLVTFGDLLRVVNQGGGV